MTDIQPDPLERELRDILRHHEGTDYAITSRELAALTGKPERTVRLVIRELIRDGLPVASRTEPPAGYYIVTSRRQAQEYADSLKSRLIEDARRRRDFRTAADGWLTPAVQEKLL